MEALETGAGAAGAALDRLGGSDVAVAATLGDLTTIGSMAERKQLDDRQLDAILERLDRLCDEVHALNRRLDTNDQLQRIVRELAPSSESLQALAYAALGSQGPQVRRRRSA